MNIYNSILFYNWNKISKAVQNGKPRNITKQRTVGLGETKFVSICHKENSTIYIVRVFCLWCFIFKTVSYALIINI